MIRFSLRYSFLFFALFVATACTRGQDDRVSLQSAAPSSSVRDGKAEYVAVFRDAAEASGHRAEVREAGGRAEFLGAERNVLAVTVAEGALARLEVPKSALLGANSLVRIQVPRLAAVPADPAEELLTARRVVGVEELLKRVPAADGRGTKVAVFDTGIDFGVQGLNLTGFYDFTGFGIIAPAVLPSEAPQENYVVGGRTIAVDASVRAQKIQSAGVLSEAQASKDYLTEETDLNSNKKTDDVFPFIVGVNAQGQPAVWIDVDQDQKWTSAEELTDFNTTFKHIDTRKDVAPSGARPLAVTIRSASEVQFHSVPRGHGTSCAIIIAGNGYADGKLRGMAPQAQMVSYLLDNSGRDVYTMEQFLKMFLHAKEQKVDAISISYGFATADLASARFFGEFMDREIASAGIVIGIAAGNSGPGITSADADDYMPRHGFAVGAMISKDQARNVYGWLGPVEDTVISYSSVGPTRGGRQVPDVVSPLMTWVRGERGTEGDQFYGFGGTSSATPALVGATTALVSALKSSGEERIDARLLKLAVENTSRPLAGVEGLRQGSGLIDVNAAFDLYRTLAAELRAARQDPLRKTAFAYDLRASVPLEGAAYTAEGIRFASGQSGAIVTVAMSEESKKLVDPLTTVVPLEVVHAGTLFDTPTLVNLQAGGAQFAVNLRPALRETPGIHSDVISLVRPSDKTVLLKIPVVIYVPESVSTRGIAVDQKLAPFEVARRSVRLARASVLRFDGLLRELGAGRGGSVGVFIGNRHGVGVYSDRFAGGRAVQVVEFQTPVLPADDYEIVFYRSYGRPAVVGEARLSGIVRTPLTRLLGVGSPDTGKFSAAVEAQDQLTLKKATVTLLGTKTQTQLSRQLAPYKGGFEAFVGIIEFGEERKAFDVELAQLPVDAALEPFLNMEVAFVDSGTGETLSRNWIDMKSVGTGGVGIELKRAVPRVAVVAYPNVVNWSTVSTRKINLLAGLPAKTPVTAEWKPKDALELAPYQRARLDFDLPGFTDSSYGKIELFEDDSVKLETLGF